MMTPAQVRLAYLRVFQPIEGQEASEQDRAMVLDDLRTHCNYDRPFTVDLQSGDAAFQLAVQEGRRSVFLRIIQAVQKARTETSKEPKPLITIKE